MVYVLGCSASAPPCPAADQQWLSLAQVNDPAEWGITPASIAAVYGFGVGAVLVLFFIGYGIAAATGMVRKV